MMFEIAVEAEAARARWQLRMNAATPAPRVELPTAPDRTSVSRTVRRLLADNPKLPRHALVEAVRMVHGSRVPEETITRSRRRARGQR